MKVYLTGFEPFGTHVRNASWEAVKGFCCSLSSVQVHKEQLPVDYRSLIEHIPARLNEIKPQLILHLGVMSDQGFLRLEEEAQNIIGSTPDNASYIPKHKDIDPLGPPAIRSQFPWRTIQKQFHERGWEARLSQDAGQYLCNFSYHLSLQWAQKNSALVGFLHVPVLGQPFGVEELREAISISLEIAGKQYSEDYESGHQRKDSHDE